jgi:hypothetical protein
MPEGQTEAISFNVVLETLCDGAGEWRTFTSPHWPIAFDYPAGWVITDDQDDVNIECPSVTALASGGSYLTFERGAFEASNEPYWFVRRAGDDWRVRGPGCDPDARPGPQDDCYPARRSARHGLMVLQGAAGEHRRYRPGIGYLGPGSGIIRYLFILGDQWVSLDSAGVNEHSDDIGEVGGPALLDGEAVGERVVRSIRLR